MNTNNLRIVNAENFNLNDIGVIKTLRPKRKPKNAPKYYDLITAFDIETSYLPDIDQSVMYVWQFAMTEDYIVIGRTWEQFTAFLDALAKLPNTFVCYVHNLSFEFQFLAGILQFETENVFCIKSRRVLRAVYRNIEFRCSYLHSNMSLEKFIEHVGGEYEKLELDYNIIRYPWTDLTKAELMYCVNDVRGLVSAIRAEMEKDGDNLYTIPLTSTGYLRREAKQALKQKRKYIQGMRCEWDVQQLLHKAFRGGDTHASRFYSGFIVPDVHSVDRSSSYPDVMVNDMFPMGAFIDAGRMTLNNVEERLGYNAMLLDVCIAGLTLASDIEPAPYLSISKCDVFVNHLIDNGRVLSADYIECVITDVDLLIMRDVYNWDSFVIRRGYVAPYGYLPEQLRDLNRKYYIKKTELKNVEGQEYFYMKSKNLLNSAYGMTAQNPAKDPINFHAARPDDNGGFIESLFTEEMWSEQIKRYWLHYAWGVWVPAWARYRLHEGRKIIAEQTHGIGWVYADTDSLKYCGNVDFTEYNNERVRRSKENGAFATDPAGVTHYMGVYEYEGTARQFRTWGAKKYAYIDDKGFHVTVSGVSKRAGASELVRAARIERHLTGKRVNGLDLFRPGFVFRDGGGSELKYDDTIDEHILIDGRDLHITRNVSIKPSTYKMSITSDYERILKYESIDGYDTINDIW